MQVASLLRVVVLLAVPGGLALSLGGCPPIPPPEAVLTGSWNVTAVPAPTTPNFVRLTLGFDDNGDLTVIKTLFVNATVVANSPEDFTATTNVSGSAVTVTVQQNNVTAFQFSGTLNSAQTQITGTGLILIDTGRGTINVPTNAQIVLTKSGR